LNCAPKVEMAGLTSMTEPLRSPGRVEELGPAEAGPLRIEVSAAQLKRAQQAYSSALEAARAWRAFSPSPRHHDMTYWTLISSLFAEPGMNRTQLVDRIIDEAGVSRSTAERAIRDARESGLIVGRYAGSEVLFDLSDVIFNHCVNYFQSWMDAAKIARMLGAPG
jgi:hypothetical protein